MLFLLSYLSVGDCSPLRSFQQSVFDRNGLKRFTHPYALRNLPPLYVSAFRNGSTAGKRSDPYPSPDKAIRLCGGGTAPLVWFFLLFCDFDAFNFLVDYLHRLLYCYIHRLGNLIRRESLTLAEVLQRATLKGDQQQV